MYFDIENIIPKVPFWLKAFIVIVLCILSAAIAYNYRDAKANEEMSNFKFEIAEASRKQSESNFNQLITSTNNINASAKLTKESLAKLGKDIESIRRDRKDYVKENPLPPDCRPDPARVRQLEAAIDRANNPAAR